MFEPIEMFLLSIGTAFAILCMSTAVFPNNRAFRYCEMTVIMGGASYSLYSYLNTLRSLDIVPMLAGRWWYILPTVLGLMAFTRIVARSYRWMARYPVAILSGVGLGIIFGGLIKTDIIGFINESATFKIFGKYDVWNGLFMLVGTIIVLTYFMYSRRISGPIWEGRGRPMLRIARLYLFANLGYMAGYVAMLDGLTWLSEYEAVYIARGRDEIVTYISGGGAYGPSLILTGFSIPIVALFLHWLFFTRLRQARQVKA